MVPKRLFSTAEQIFGHWTCRAMPGFYCMGRGSVLVEARVNCGFAPRVEVVGHSVCLRVIQSKRTDNSRRMGAGSPMSQMCQVEKKCMSFRFIPSLGLHLELWEKDSRFP